MYGIFVEGQVAGLPMRMANSVMDALGTGDEPSDNVWSNIVVGILNQTISFDYFRGLNEVQPSFQGPINFINTGNSCQ